MISHSIFIAGMLYCLGVSASEVPETGRWQDLEYTAKAVNQSTAIQYRETIAMLSKARQLDQDPALLKRVQRISKGLIRIAAQIKPDSKRWKWEIHLTSSPDVDALCMAGGKILIGSAFVHRLHLNNGELATLIGHEMAHAVAEHHREELSEVLHINAQPGDSLDLMAERLRTDFSLQLKLADLSNTQEREADHIGMIMAHQAGWPKKDILNFYLKLAKTDNNAVISSSYPAFRTRVSLAKALNALWRK
ncbi:MAG: M48 family metalloprotease [Burkholderiales bacterium]|nr:M48 family metalloprotease [Burkholderiales bacterium]